MNVEQILRQKGSDVLTIGPDASVQQAIEMLRQHGIGALLVTDLEGFVKGILSERDIVRCLAEHGATCMGMAVSDLMTQDVEFCTPEQSINEVMTRMTQGRFRHLPVMRDNRLIGLISIGDVVKSRIEEVEYEANAMRQYIAAS